MSEPTTQELSACLARLHGGDPNARADLIRHTAGRLRRLTQHMLRGYARVRQFEETDDVFNTALLRLHRALEEVRPATLADYYRLAGTQVRRVLIDLARHYFGPQGLGRNWQPTGAPAEEESQAPYEGQNTTYDPGRLAAWSELHRQAEALPEEEREVFNLLWYQDLTQPEAAEVLGVSLATVKRRWLSARLRLQEALKGALPGL
jgi:RNA polymerase sigma-70 factor (ECF subfamily)